MRYKFYANGHPNILGTHKTTLEFTKDDDLSLRGNCIIGVKADFELDKLKEFIRKSNNKKISITMKTISKNKKYKKVQEKIYAELNPSFNSNNELVIRKTDFVSERTFAIKADKAAFELNKDLVEQLKNLDCVIEVTIISY